MYDSILLTIKKMIGLDANYTAFDPDIIVGINSALSILHQIGLGDNALIVTDANVTWSDLLGTITNLEDVKQYVYLRTRRIFDPPASSSVMTAIDNEIKELESRINYVVDIPEEDEDE